MCFFQNKPFSEVRKVSGYNNFQLFGYVPDLWRSLEEALNFTTVFVPSVDDKWGAINDSGVWDGLLGMILRDETDAALVDLTLTKQRALDFQYTYPIHVDRYDILFYNCTSTGCPYRALESLILRPFSG